MKFGRLAMCTLIAAILAGCGVRGSLEPPAPAQAPEGTETVVEAPEDDTFILDGLLM